MTKAELYDSVLANMDKSTKENHELIMKNINSLSKAIHPNRDLDSLFFDFYMSAVESGVMTTIETLYALGFFEDTAS